MHIYIPTRGRGPAKQHTYHRIMRLCRGVFPVQVVCPVEEYGDFTRAQIPALVCPAKGIGAVRQWIVDQCPGNRVLMLDDDLKQWAVRDDPDVGKYSRATDDDIFEALSTAAQRLHMFAHVGIGHRLFANNQPHAVFNARAMRAFGVRKDVMQRHNITFMPLVEDIEIIIQFLRAGYSNCVDYTVVQDQAASNADGGCSTYRSLAYHNEWIEEVARRHAGYVNVVTKTTAGGWFDGQPRKEIIVQWAKLVRDYEPMTIREREASHEKG